MSSIMTKAVMMMLYHQPSLPLPPHPHYQFHLPRLVFPPLRQRAHPILLPLLRSPPLRLAQVTNPSTLFLTSTLTLPPPHPHHLPSLDGDDDEYLKATRSTPLSQSSSSSSSQENDSTSTIAYLEVAAGVFPVLGLVICGAVYRWVHNKPSSPTTMS